jgi:LysM repeat protein
MAPDRDLAPTGTGGLTTTVFADLVVMGRTFRVETTFGVGDTVFGVSLGDLSLGDILRYMVGLVPGAGTLKLESPWSVLNEINLRDLEFKYNATQGKVGFTYRHLNLDLVFVRIDDLELWYGPKSTDATTRTLEVRLFGRLADKTYTYPDQPFSWEPLAQPAPAVPSGSPKIFDLEYLGLGQHVTLRDGSALTTMKGTIDALVGSYKPIDEDANPLARLPALTFDAASGWLIGARFSVLDTVYLSAIFNDPNLYGLRVELAGERAKIFAGLQFEILYRKVTEDVGVFHTELQLPDAMRHFELGAISITLPVAVVDIYTNGDFTIDLGFPYNLDFSRSFTLETFIGPIPVVGAGGVRFGAMSGLTSAEVPSITNGRFAPVLTFGLGLQLGVGKSLSLGILSGGVLIAVEGLLEGVLAFFEPEDGSQPAGTFYRLRGMIRVSAHVYGRINFVIIQAAVDVYAYASVSGTLQAHEPMVLAIEAGVSASLSVKIVFFRVKLSFSAKVRETITIGHATPTPWRVALDGTHPSARALGAGLQLPRATGEFARRHLRRRLAWRGMRVGASVRTLDVYVQPVITIGRNADAPGRSAQTAGDAAVQLVLSLFVPLESADPLGDAGFKDLARAELLWALAAFDESPSGASAAERDPSMPPAEVRRSTLEHIIADLTSEHPHQPIGLPQLEDFLRQNFLVRIQAMPGQPAARDALVARGLTLFPMPPYVTLETGEPTHRVDFETFNPCGPDYIRVVQEYFRQVSVEVAARPAGVDARPAATVNAPATGDSMAAFIFVDYLTLVLRQLLQSSLAAFDERVVSAEPGTTLLDLASRYEVKGEDPVTLLALANQDNAAFFADGAKLTVRGILAQVRDGESLAAFAARAALDPFTLVRAVRSVRGVLNVGATMTIPGAAGQPASTVVIEPGDTWRSLASKHGRTIGELVSEPANLGSPDLLAKHVTLRLPPIEVTVKAGADAAPLALARRFGVDVVTLVVSNAGSTTGFGTVRLPAFERLPADELLRTLDEGDAFAAVAGTVARCLMGGLRLPDPQEHQRVSACAALDHGAEPWSDVPLYPLAVLTGQQWPAPLQATPQYAMRLSLNASDGGAGGTRPSIVFASDDPEHGVTITLGAEECSLASDYARLLAQPSGPFDPAMLAATRLAPYAVAERRYALGPGRVWAAPDALPLGDAAQCTGLPLLFALPEAVREQLARSPTAAPDLRLMVGPPGVPGAPPPDARELTARAWATCIRFSIQRVAATGDPASFISGVYSVYGGDLDSPRLLRQTIDALAGLPASPRIDILYRANATDPIRAAVQSDRVDPQHVLLAKANLSAVTHPPRVRTLLMRVGAGTDVVSHATLADWQTFLTLLWEACVTNAGGFYLLYHIGGGQALPPQLFNQTDTASLELLITVLDPEARRSAPARRYHNTVVCAETFGVVPHVFVAPPRHVLSGTETFASLSAALGTTVADLAAANATQRDLVRPGIAITLPAAGVVNVHVGDTLLDIALREAAPSVAAVAAAVDKVSAPLQKGAEVYVHPGWVYRRPVAPPGAIGFRLLRADPEPGANAERGVVPSTEDAPTRLQVLYNLLAYRLAQSPGFRASPYGLPVTPGQDRSQASSVPVPWRYSRMLAIAPYATSRAGGSLEWQSDPYVGVGEQATLEFELCDVFGNRCAADVAPLDVPVGYTDPVVPLSQWPSVNGSYDFPGPGQVSVRFAFEGARYVPISDGTLASAIARATADRELVARIEAQVRPADVRVVVTSTFALVEQPLDKQRVLELLRGVSRYLGTVSSLQPLQHHVAAGDDLLGIAGAYQLPLEVLAAANADEPGLLAAGSQFVAPQLYICAPNDSLASICDRAGFDLTPGMLAKVNKLIPLAANVTLRIDGKDVELGASDTLLGLAHAHDTKVEAIARGNAAVPGLFAPGTQVLLRTDRGSVEPDATLSGLARVHGLSVAALAAANAKNPQLLGAGVRLVIPEHAVVGDDRAAAYQVRPGDSLRSVANALHVSIGALTTANLHAVEVLRHRPPSAALSYRAPGSADAIVEKIRKHDTLATVLRRFRARPGCASLSIEELAEQNRDADTLLDPGAFLLAPPEDLVEVFTCGFKPPDAIFPVTVTLRIERDRAHVDPAMQDDPEPMAATTDLAPNVSRARRDGASRRAAEANTDDARSLHAFARRLAKAFPGVRLAVAADAPGDPLPMRPLTAVSLPDQISYAIEQVPYFFAPRPLLTRLWTSEPSCPVPVPAYANGSVTGSTNAAFSGIDLDAWGRGFLAAVDRFLSPEIGLAACHLLGAGADYDRAVSAKRGLARAVRQQTIPVVDEPAGAPRADVEAAREALYQRMLVELSAAYDVDAIVQFRVVVRSPYTTRATAPRLNGRVTAATITVDARATLRDLARRCEAPLDTFGAVAGDLPYLLTPGFMVGRRGGATHVVEAHDTLRSVAAAIEVSVETLVNSYSTDTGLLRAGATLPLMVQHRRASADDTVGTLLDALTRGTPVEQALPVFLGMNGRSSALLLPGADILLPGAARHCVTPGETLEDVARQLGRPALELLAAILDQPGLVAEAADVRYLSRLPGFTVSTAKIPLANGETSLTFLVDLAANAACTAFGVDLGYVASEIEYDIEDAGIAPGYQQSRWLSLVEPLRHDRLPRIDIPVALRSHPTAPVLLSQTTRQEIPEHPTLDQIKAYDFVCTYACSPAAQDQVRSGVEMNLTGGVQRLMSADPTDTLPYSLARYNGIARALWRDLEPLAQPQMLEGNQQLFDAARGAVAVFADLATEIARAWQAWSDAGSMDLSASGDRRFGSAGGTATPAAAPAVARARVPSLRASSDTAADLVLTHRMRGLDVLDVQNIRGFVEVERNHDLLTDRRTRPEFVYTTERVRALSLLWPAITWRESYDMTAVPPLRQWPDPRLPLSRLADFFGNLLDVTPETSAGGSRPVRVGVSFLYPLNDAERERLLADGTAPAMLSEIPIALQPAVDFDAGRDLVAAGGMCAQLAQCMERWAKDNPAMFATRAGYFRFDITVCSNLPELDGSRRPLLALPSVRLSLADIDLGTARIT